MVSTYGMDKDAKQPLTPVARIFLDWLTTTATPGVVYPSHDAADEAGVAYKTSFDFLREFADVFAPYHLRATRPHPPKVRAGSRVWGTADTIKDAIAEGY